MWTTREPWKISCYDEGLKTYAANISAGWRREEQFFHPCLYQIIRLSDSVVKTITVTEASRNFSDLVSRVHYQGESALLVKGGRPMVKIIAARRPKTGRHLAALWPDLPPLGRKDAESFGRDLEAARRSLPALKSRWD
jgi:antitoxin (DNA-binding transcriptional repressor) of toxin-antitoxin stability system